MGTSCGGGGMGEAKTSQQLLADFHFGCEVGFVFQPLWSSNIVSRFISVLQSEPSKAGNDQFTVHVTSDAKLRKLSSTEVTHEDA